ncbi:hypothetical protein C8R43DRAFT_427695 [Mycena crocata]|nr:hypothetical protein C8R43DRAFT_427695 [Mycena crocata]
MTSFSEIYLSRVPKSTQSIPLGIRWVPHVHPSTLRHRTTMPAAHPIPISQMTSIKYFFLVHCPCPPTDNLLSTPFQWTLAYVPYLAFNAEEGNLINAAGCICTFYNATHEVHTHFYNGTQESSVSVVEFHNPLNTTYKSSSLNYHSEGGDSSNPNAGVHGVSFAPRFGANAHLIAMADAFTSHLNGDIIRNGHTGVITSTTLLSETSLLSPRPH